MKIAEKATLRDYIESVDGICERFSDAREFYNNIDCVPDFSLQNIAFEKDMDFLDEVSKILSVISSIVSHPHLSNKREEIVIRIEQARQLQQDAFMRVMQDSSLWKDHGGKMVPENVYYYQYVDELRIYENQFIVLLVDLLDVEITKCNSFYVHKLPVAFAGANVDISPLTTSIPQDDCAIAIKRAEELKRRIRFIKNTYFYKVVSVGKGISPIIKPTNILLKDRLYRKCFKFYRKFVRYDGEHSLKEDLAKYASVIILKTFQSLGFTLSSITEGTFRVPVGVIRKLIKRSGQKVSGGLLENGEAREIAVNRAIAPFFNGATFKFFNKGFNVECGYLPKEGAIWMNVDFEGKPLTKVSHLLMFDSGEEDYNIDAVEDFLTTDIFSIWNSFVWENNDKRILSGDFNEKEMIKRWILSKITVISGDREVHSKYCPVCKVKSVEPNGDNAVCLNCNSEYLFLGDSENRIWIRKIRRV